MKLALVRRGLLVAALVAGLVSIFEIFRSVQPLENWLSLRLFVILAATGLFVLAALVAGHRVVSWLMGDSLEPMEHWPIAFATGVLCFFTGTFVAGVLDLFGSVAFSLGLPLLLLLTGWSSFVSRVGREVAEGRWRVPRLKPLEVVALGAVAIALFLVYVPVLDPDNMSFDAMWYHVPNAEHYMAAGRIAPLVEARMGAVIPQLATVLYVWAMHLPTGGLWDRMVLIGHLEFVTVLGTLAALPALFRALHPGPVRPYLAIAAFFLFPAIFVYDTALHAGADHFCALFAAPAWLMLLRFWPRLDGRAGALLGLQVAGLVLCKYVAAPAVAVLALAVVIRAVWLAVVARPGARLQVMAVGPLICAGVVLAATSPHWLKNWVFYGNPVFPFLSSVFTPSIWGPDAPEYLRQFGIQGFTPNGNFKSNLQGALRALYDFSYDPRHMWGFNGRQPTTGSVFSVLLIALPFLRAGRRIWAIALAVLGAVFIWHFMSHQERYLLILVPWMAAATAAMIAVAWKEALPFKLLVSAVVAVQMVASADIPFYPRGPSPSQSGPARAMALLGSSHMGARRNLERFTGWQRIGKTIPQNGKLLVHQLFSTIGLQRQTLLDLLPHQFGLSYGRLGSLSAIDDRLKEMGVTHVAWHGGHNGYDSVAGELLFHAYFQSLGGRSIEGVTVAALPETRPPPHGDVVQYVGCERNFKTGLYRLSQLALPMSADQGSPVPLIAVFPEPFKPGLSVPEAQWLAVENACRQNVDVSGFTLVVRIPFIPLGEVDLYRRP